MAIIDSVTATYISPVPTVHSGSHTSRMHASTIAAKNAAVAAMESPMTEKEWRDVSQSLENLHKFSELYCTGCGYCQPCPKEINIPRIFQAYTHHNVYGLSETAKKMYNGYVNNEKKPGATPGTASTAASASASARSIWTSATCSKR